MNSPFCGWDKNSFNNSTSQDFDFLQLSKTQPRGKNPGDPNRTPGASDRPVPPEPAENRQNSAE